MVSDREPGSIADFFFLISMNIILLKVKPSFVLNCRLCSFTNYLLAEAELGFLMVWAYIFCYL